MICALAMALIGVFLISLREVERRKKVKKGSGDRGGEEEGRETKKKRGKRKEKELSRSIRITNEGSRPKK